MSATIRRIVEAGIPVMGHIGLTPQSIHSLGGFKVQGKELDAAQALTDDAIALAEAWAKWFHRWTSAFSRERMDGILDFETGGMLEVWAELFGITGKGEYRELMDRYARRKLFDPLLEGSDPLTNMHANTTIPEVLGAARAYEVTREGRWLDIAKAYWDLAAERLPRFATGGGTTGEVWVPQNLNNTVEYQVNLEYAMVWSKNVPSVQLFKLVGGKDVEAWARRLGMTTPIIADQALALGASCTRIDELTRAFSAFARNGSLEEPVYLRRVRDRAGHVLEDNTAVSDPVGPPDVRLDRMVARAGRSVKNVIPPRAAWLTSQLLRRVVTKGHAPSLRSSGLLVAGKTGTSSATMDTWFVGYTSRSMITTWIGDDRRERPLGYKDAAFMLTVPMAARFLSETTAGQPLRDVPWERPAGVRANDTGGNLRANMEAVKAEDEAAGRKRKG